MSCDGKALVVTTISQQILDSREAAALLKIHPKTLQKLARDGDVPAFQIGTLWRFVSSELDEWIDKRISSKSPLVS
jgi:excisionase family DNA binding protein